MKRNIARLLLGLMAAGFVLSGTGCSTSTTDDTQKEESSDKDKDDDDDDKDKDDDDDDKDKDDDDDKKSSSKKKSDKDDDDKDSVTDIDDAEYADAYYAFIRDTQAFTDTDSVTDKSDAVMDTLYYALPPMYDVFNALTDATYDDYVSFMTAYAESVGASQDELDERLTTESYDAFKSSMDNSVYSLFESLSESFSEATDGIDMQDALDSAELVSEEKLTGKELSELEDLIISVMDGSGMTIDLSYLGLDIDDYKVEKGYKVTIDIDGEEKEIKFYYMNGDWRWNAKGIFSES